MPTTLPPPGMIRLAVVDMGGTTVRDGGVVEGAIMEALSGVGLDALRREQAVAAIRSGRGRRKSDILRDVCGPQSVEDAHRRLDESLIRAIDRGDVPALPGAADALGELRDMGVRVCLATGFSGRVRDRLLESLGWRSSVDLALSSDEVPRGRPHPDLVLTAILRLSIDSVDEVAVVGDTVNDLIAGTRAGASVVAGVLTGAHDLRELTGAPHTHLIPAIGDFPAVVAAAGERSTRGRLRAPRR